MIGPHQYKQLAHNIILQTRQKRLLQITTPKISFHPLVAIGVAGTTNDTTYAVRVASNLEPYDVIGTLLHELKHVEQFQTGKLIANRTDGVITWCGIDYDYEEFDYEDMPWEHEAEQFISQALPVLTLPRFVTRGVENRRNTCTKISTSVSKAVYH